MFKSSPVGKLEETDKPEDSVVVDEEADEKLSLDDDDDDNGNIFDLCFCCSVGDVSGERCSSGFFLRFSCCICS